MIEKGDVWLSGRRVRYGVITSRKARRLRIRVGPTGLNVVRPVERNGEDVAAFLHSNAEWILNQLQRVDPLHALRRPPSRSTDLLYRGVRTPVRIRTTTSRSGRVSIAYDGVRIVVRRGELTVTPVGKSLEIWLRRQARAAIMSELSTVTRRLGARPNRVYVMDQRTKWGNCSARGNLSFSWRLVLAPEFVLRYLVTHEAVHLVVPDHSAKFWLTVQSLCGDAEKARQWLAANADGIRMDPIPALG